MEILVDIYKKLRLHLEESFIHINRLDDVLKRLEKLYPLNHEKMESILPQENETTFTRSLISNTIK